ncbi:MAG TPA: MATE family efflux transporter [Candidatus Paenalcaligenes intestinipullorum]|uniref:Multidrug-efflux transporter n=1 Tax=Candidatus Paenalcaligenes intestinipullorum TaxID=2838718 RepID=A0A9D2RJ66_9BURK|nr:MATE family efflux transporter [Candidatus Paenalcaligenes intestinipullorum]
MNTMKTAQAWHHELVAALRLGSPLILTNLAQVALLTTNIVFLGRIGKQELAAASLAGSLYQACMIFSLGLVSATIPMLAHSLGKEHTNFAEVRDIIRHGFLTAGLICLPFWLLLWNIEPLLLAMGQNPDTAALAKDYTHVLQWGLLPYLGYIVLRSLLAAVERPFWTLWIAIAAIFLNMLLGWGLSFGHFGLPALGLRGPAFATVTSSIFMFAAMIVLVQRHPFFKAFEVFQNWWHVGWPRLKALLQLGVPIAITFTLETLVFYAAVLMMGTIGDTALAAHAIVIQLCAISYMFPLGFGQVATIRVGRAVGRAEPIAATQAGWVSYALGVGCMAIAALLMWWIPDRLIGFFINVHAPENRAVLITATHFIFFAALFQLTDGAQAVAAGMLRGLYDTRVPMVLALIGYWVIGVPVGALLAFGFDFEGVGIWMGLVCGLTVVAVLMTLRWVRFSRRLRARSYINGH